MPIHLAAAALALAITVPANAQTAGPFTLSSKEVAAGKQIPLAQLFGGMGCTGKNVSPSLAWHGAPAATRSFAVTMYDPDAPTGSGWWHWVVYNIPGNVSALAAGAAGAYGPYYGPGYGYYGPRYYGPVYYEPGPYAYYGGPYYRHRHWRHHW